MALHYHRILLKLSGEALAGAQGCGLDPAICRQFAFEIKEATAQGAQIGVVVGGGNIFRGLSATGKTMRRTYADTIGMLATAINGLTLVEYLFAEGVPARVLNANALDKAAETYTSERARACLNAGEVVFMTGGTGNPFFTTDTAAALRCAEIGAEVLLKATKVDGVYDADPVTTPTATKLETLTHAQALEQGLKVMDATAFSFCQHNQIPIVVFKLLEEGNLLRCLTGQRVGSLVTTGV